ncbi:helix-turn-helix transcriptional regulator [Mycobacteroides chelonae]
MSFHSEPPFFTFEVPAPRPIASSGGIMRAQKPLSHSGLLHVGERIELRRRHKHLSRKVVAELVGRSEEWLRLVETGQLRLDSVRTILRLAEVLQIEDYRQLIDYPTPQMGAAPDNANELVERLVPILVDHPAAGGQREQARTYAPIKEQVYLLEEVWSTSQQRYELLTRQLPRVVADYRNRHWHNHSTEVRDALIRTYCLTARILGRLNAHQLAAIAGDRALGLAQSSDSPQHIAVSSWHWATALLNLQQNHRCRDFALAISQTVEPQDEKPDDAVLYGALQLLAARSLAASDPSATNRYLGRLQQLAASTGGDRSVVGVAFGPSEVATARMDIALSRNDFDGAIDAARSISNPDRLAIGHRARYFIALATAFAGRREIVSATFALIQASEACPEDLRYDPDAHTVLRQIIEHDDRFLSTKVAHLADLAGL